MGFPEWSGGSHFLPPERASCLPPYLNPTKICLQASLNGKGGGREPAREAQSETEGVRNREGEREKQRNKGPRDKEDKKKERKKGTEEKALLLLHFCILTFSLRTLSSSPAFNTTVALITIARGTRSDHAQTEQYPLLGGKKRKDRVTTENTEKRKKERSSKDGVN